MLKHEKYTCLFLFKNPFLHNWVVDIEKYVFATVQNGDLNRACAV